MKLLMHICCAPCANMPIDALRADGIDLTGYWYNPNIHPFTEYRARRNCLQEYAKTIGLPLLVRDDYGLRPFVRAVADDIAGRCVKCYEMRLFEAARMAKEGGFDAFTSSLFISPYQQLQIVGRIPVIHLLADIRILIPGKRCLVIPVIGDQPDLFVYDLLFYAFRNSSFGTASCSFLPISIRTSRRSGSALE